MNAVETCSFKDPVEIYHIEGRRSFRVIWACEELDIPYRLHFKRGDIIGSLALIRGAYPTMPMAPVVRIGESYIVESGAVLDILATRCGAGKLRPDPASSDFLMHCQWMHFAEGTAMARMVSERFNAIALGVDISSLPEGYRQGE